MKIRGMRESQRPREKMVLYGSQALTDSELLAILLKTGTRNRSAIEVADIILNHDAEGLRNIADMSLEELQSFEGVGLAKACQIKAAVELGRRIAQSRIIDKGRVTAIGDVLDMFMEEMRYEKKELFKALLLDSKGGILSKETISVGDLSSSIVHPRETFKSAVRRSAASVLFVHNHPSGDPTPSKEDIVVTRRLVEAGDILGITVLDHVVIGDGTYVSLKEKEII